MFVYIKKSLFGSVLCVCGVFVIGISSSAILLTEDVPQQIVFNVSGLIPAALTSLYLNNTVNLESIPAYVNYLVENELKAVLVGGSSGEHMYLRLEDRKRIIAEWVKARGSQDLHLWVQVGGAPFAEVIDLAKYCSTLRVDSILTLPDMYHKPATVEDLVSYVELVANATPNLPVLYYHNPKKTQVNINMPAFVAAAKRIPNFRGIKFTSNDLVEAVQVLDILEEGQQIVLGGTHLTAPAALMGIDSFATPIGNIYPGVFRDILQAVRSGAVSEARELQKFLSAVVNKFSAQGGRIAALKYALEQLTGIAMGPPALPSKPLSTNQKMNILRLVNQTFTFGQETLGNNQQ